MPYTNAMPENIAVIQLTRSRIIYTTSGTIKEFVIKVLLFLLFKPFLTEILYHSQKHKKRARL
jgi:hypothetical protein